MRIKRLWISKYKNIEDLTLCFDNKLTTLLVGLNGSGKSNILEATSIIFRELDLADTSKDLSQENSSFFFEFEIEYSCKGYDINIEADHSTLTIETKLSSKDEEYRVISFSEFKRDRRKKYLPDFIIGYYSGENKRIREIFHKHSETRNRNLKNVTVIKNQAILGRLFFTEQNFGELIFLTLWVYKNHTEYGKKIKLLLHKLLNIDFESKIEVNLWNPDFYTKRTEKNADDLFDNLSSNMETPFWGIRGELDRFLRVLYDNNTSVPIAFADENETSEKNKFEFIKFTDLDFDTLIDDLSENFEKPVQVFDVIQAADSIGVIQEINVKLVKNGVSLSHNYKELSEGEQQLLTTIGLLLIIGEFDSLFLYDEPDTHLNPQWQREYAQLIKDFTLEDSKCHVLVATHSPMIVQAAERADLFLFKKGRDSVRLDKASHRIGNWRIDQVLQSEYFGLVSSRPPSLDNYMKKREEILHKESIDGSDKVELEKFENEFGVLPTGETLTDLEALQLIHSIIKESKNDKN